MFRLAIYFVSESSQFSTVDLVSKHKSVVLYRVYLLETFYVIFVE